MKFPFNLTYENTARTLEGIGRTARKTLCRKIIGRAELIEYDFIRLTQHAQEVAIQEMQDLFEKNMNCNDIPEKLMEMKIIYQRVNKEYLIIKEYAKLRSVAHEEYSKAQTQDAKIAVSRMFEILRKMYYNVDQAARDDDLIRAVYENDKTFEKQAIENKGW